MRFLLCLVLALLLGACESGEPESTLSADDNAKAEQLLHDYNSARDAENWEAAQQLGDRLRTKYGDSSAAETLRETYEETAKRADAKRAENRLAAMWNYQNIPAGAGKQYTATIDSRVARDDDGIAMGKPDARLVLRVHPEWGHSAYLLLTQKAFECGNPCTMKISFDGAEPVPYKGRQADSGQGPALFIVDYKNFYAAMENSAAVKIALPKTGEYAPTLVFDVGGYDAARLGTEF